jgi:hypothetical protein
MKVFICGGIHPSFQTLIYYLKRRDPKFAEKMPQVLGVYRKVKMLKKTAAAAKRKRDDAVAIISHDEKPGIQAIANTSPDLPPQPGVHASFSRDHEYKRKGTMSLLAGIDLLSGQVHALVRDRHRSCEFIDFLRGCRSGRAKETYLC